ncbi:hypothetical protein B0J12DRAFT_181962 [Macrophomina phaseolina]|uniref:Uncharacterized protein n=1 Tax=Macrophomina phaseolina TaxID=35725 RepID=A0ABQ8G4K8_9PEZI|nr:hypothetical protein B0J12DRAFT_181962 [Macrophomina phaseolina]
MPRWSFERAEQQEVPHMKQGSSTAQKSREKKKKKKKKKKKRIHSTTCSCKAQVSSCADGIAGLSFFPAAPTPNDSHGRLFFGARQKEKNIRTNGRCRELRMRRVEGKEEGAWAAVRGADRRLDKAHKPSRAKYVERTTGEDVRISSRQLPVGTASGRAGRKTRASGLRTSADPRSVEVLFSWLADGAAAAVRPLAFICCDAPSRGTEPPPANHLPLSAGGDLRTGASVAFASLASPQLFRPSSSSTGRNASRPTLAAHAPASLSLSFSLSTR